MKRGLKQRDSVAQRGRRTGLLGVSPILAHHMEPGRVRFESACDREIVDAMALTVRKEGIIPALESSHAFAQTL